MRAGDTLGAISFRKREEISSGLIALCGFKVSKGAKIRNRYNQVPHLTKDTKDKPSSIFLAPLFCITSGGASVCRLLPMEGMLLQSSLVKIEANWLFRISALSLASE